MKNPLWLFCVLALLLCAGPDGPARADWMNLTGAETAPNIAEIYVEDDRVRLALEIYVGDLAAFQDLVPDDWLPDTDATRPALAERLRRFATETFRIVTETGTVLPAELTLAEARQRKDRFSPFAGMINPTTRQRVPEPPADKRVLYVEIAYPFAAAPKTLTFMPPGDRAGVAQVNIGFILYHKSVPVIDFRYLSGPATVNLDWDDPWYSRFDNPTLKRHHKSALMSFLYVEPGEVRHEVLTRVRDLEEWMDLGLRREGRIDADEWDGLMARVGAFLLTRNQVLIDGRAVAPTVARTNFVSVGLAGIRLIEEPRSLDISTAILGVILSYPVDALPERVTVDWDLFTDQIQRVPATAIDPAGPLVSYVEPADRRIEWRNFLKDYSPPTVEAVPLGAGFRLGLPLPSLIVLLAALVAGGLAFRPAWLGRKAWLAVGLAGLVGAGLMVPVGHVDIDNPFAGPPDQQTAVGIVGRLVGNLHTAMREPQESKQRVALSASLDTPRTAELLPELRRALAIEIQGGGNARVDRIDAVAVKDIEGLGQGGGFRAVAEWSADASAGHWGHLHKRRLRFSALIELVPVDGTWKLAGLTVVNVAQES